jgi:hypothetical protein
MRPFGRHTINHPNTRPKEAGARPEPPLRARASAPRSAPKGLPTLPPQAVHTYYTPPPPGPIILWPPTHGYHQILWFWA